MDNKAIVLDVMRGLGAREATELRKTASTLTGTEIIDQERWEDSLGNPLGMQLTALRTILRACDEEGVDGGALAGLAANMQKGVDERGGDGGIPIAGKYLLK